MSSAGESTHLKVVTVGDFDPQSDNAIEYDFIGRVIAGRYTIREQIGMVQRKAEAMADEDRGDAPGDNEIPI